MSEQKTASKAAHPFVHLHVHSAYSLAEGAIGAKDLVKICKNNNMPAVAVTDSNNLFGALEFAIAAAGSGVQPILGCQVDVGHEIHQLVLLVQSEEGYRNICRIISHAYMEGDPSQNVHADWEVLESHSEGLICLTGGIRGPVGQYLLHNQAKDAEKVLKRLKKAFGDRLYMELQRHGWPEEQRIEEAMIDLAYKHEVGLVATNDCYFPKRSMHRAHDALLCIAEGRYVSEDDRRKVTYEHYFKMPQEMEALFKDLPEAIANTSIIAQRCHFLLKPIDPILPPFDTKGGRSEEDELTAQSEEGLHWRLENFVYPEDADDAKKKEISKPYFERLEFELGIIKEMGFPGYFLIVSDFIRWSKEQNIPVGPGRGSGAGSVVAWALKITDLDPLEHSLLFERFLNPERVSMPDFDVDFCQERRDEVIKYVQDKYGHDKVAQIITFGKLQARAVVRDVGRVLQMPYGQVDRLAKMIPANPANPITLSEALEQDADLRAEKNKEQTSIDLIDIALELEGLYRHASTHAAGVVIGDRPLPELIPVYRDPRSDMPVTQFNMKFVEQAGLVKFDFLGLKTLTVIQKALENIKEHKGEDIDILQIPMDDKKTYKLMAEGKTVGVFQLESAGMRDAMRKMKPDFFGDIIALVSLYRPGPMDNIPVYIARKEGREEPDYMHPKLQPYLEETYGIMIYQEQVMQAAQALSGYTLGGADLLRRAMGKKIAAEMDAQREMFVTGAKEHSDVGEDQANKIFDQIAKFAGYGFNKSHAAAYALIAYQTAWLKANYPVEFMAALMTLDAGNTDKLAVFKQEVEEMGIEMLTPDVNKSGVMFQVEGQSIRYALAALKGVGEQAMRVLVNEREENGAFKDMNDFVDRIDSSAMNKRQFEMLACSGAFECLEPSRRKVYEGAEVMLRHAQSLAKDRDAGQESLFGAVPDVVVQGPALPDVEEWDHLEKLRKEYDAVGFYLSAHPLDSKVDLLEQRGVTACARVIDSFEGGRGGACKMAGVLLKKQIKVSPRSGKKYAFLQFSDSSGVYEVTVFSELLERYKDSLNVGEAFLLNAVVEIVDGAQVRYTIQNMEALDQALEREIREVTIWMNEAEPVSQLKALLDQEGKGPIKIRLIVDVSDADQAEMTLPGKWKLSPEARMALTKSPGVLELREG